MQRTTVVMMTRDRRAEVLRTLAHMTALPDAAPIVLVDNGSADGTSEAVRERFPQVRLIRSERNLGAVARNLAMTEVRTPYVAFCDDDTRWQPGALTRAADLLDAHPSVAAVMGRCVIAPELVDDPLLDEVRNSPVPAPPGLPGPAVLGVLAATSTFRVRAFHDAGGFSPRLWLGGEEELLVIDLAVLGWWCCYAEEVVVHHEPSRTRQPSGRRRLGIRNTLWTIWLRRPVRSALRRSRAVLASAPKDRHTLAAVAAALGGLPWVLREREVVPDRVEHALRLLEEPQRHSRARRYVG